MGLCASTTSVRPEPSVLPGSPLSTSSSISKNETRPQTTVSPTSQSLQVDTSNLHHSRLGSSGGSSTTTTTTIPFSTTSRTPSTPRKRGTVQKNRWKRGDMIGAGSYGRVFMGLNMDTGGLIAIKELVFSPDNVNEVAAMQQEINLMRSLDHPNIVKYLGTEMGDTNNMLYIFTEWVPGGSLQSLLKKFGKFDDAVTRKYTFQILQGLQFLHLNRVVHRDIKGANILIDDKGTVKLADFGASKQLSGTMATMQEDNMSLRGTPYFMAPEVITQTGHGRKADVWSVGCTVLQMCTGLPPWKTMKFGSISALMYHVANTNDPPPMPEDISDAMRSSLYLCFQRQPTQRPSVDELIQHSFVSSVAADFASMTLGNQGTIDLSQVLNSNQNSRSGSNMSNASNTSYGSINSSADAIAFDDRGAMNTNDVLGTLSLDSDHTIDGSPRRLPNGSPVPAGNEPFDITSFSLASPAPEASIREHLSAMGKKTEAMGNGMRSSPSPSPIGASNLNPFSTANVDGVLPDSSDHSDHSDNSDNSVNENSQNNPQEHSLTVEEAEAQRLMNESYIKAQERPLTTDHAVKMSQDAKDRDIKSKAIKAAREAAWQKELADELALQKSMRTEY
jgi:serine/threonine protein kinase